MKVLMIVNPESGKANTRKNLIDAISVFSKRGYEVEIYATQGKMDAYRKAKERGEAVDIVVACGGDGTLNEVTNGLMGLVYKPTLGYFPTGTMNDFASNFGLTNNWKLVAERICAGHKTAFDVGLFNHQRYFNYVAGFGAFCDASYATPRDAKAAFGNLAYIVHALSEVPNIHPTKVKVTVGEKVEEINALFGLIFSGNRVSGVELMSKKEGKVDDGQFNVVVVEYAENLDNVNDYLAFLTKKESSVYHWFKGSEVTLDFESDMNWTVDGEEVNSGSHVVIRNLKQSLELMK